jgi:hypothetical protein
MDSYNGEKCNTSFLLVLRLFNTGMSPRGGPGDTAHWHFDSNTPTITASPSSGDLAPNQAAVITMRESAALPAGFVAIVTITGITAVYPPPNGANPEGVGWEGQFYCY